MFPRDLWPEEFEFPSCYLCNNGTSKHDTIFGYYSMRLDFNEDNRSPADLERQQKLRHEIAKRYPDALPDSEEPIFRVGHIIIPSPVAVSVDTKPAVREAMRAIGEKLAHALFYREMKRILNAPQVLCLYVSAPACRNRGFNDVLQAALARSNAAFVEGAYRKGTWSLSVTANRRLTFRIDAAEHEIYDVNLEDYHAYEEPAPSWGFHSDGDYRSRRTDGHSRRDSIARLAAHTVQSAQWQG
jgi:hypothetical protein